MENDVGGLNRRKFLTQTGHGASLSTAGLGLLVGTGGWVTNAYAASGSDKAAAGDVAILNTALALEHEGIMAYQIGAESGLLTAAVKAVAINFQSHHKAHRQLLREAIETLGGKPVSENPRSHYEKSLQVTNIGDQADILNLAARLELGAVNAYVSVIDSFHADGLATAAAKLIADEVMHWTVLTQVQNQALPEQALSFG